MLWGGLLLAVALALRLYRLGAMSLWVDEYYSLVIAQHSLAEIPAAALLDAAFQPPFYFWLLHLVIGSFGDSETALRALSAVAGAVTVPLTLLLVRGLGASPGVAILCAALLSVSPLHLWYSQDARPYALLVCLGVGSLACLLGALRSGATMAWTGFAALASLAALTHVTGLVFPLIGWIWAIRQRRDRSVFRALLASSLVIALVTAPFGYLLVQSVFSAEAPGSPRSLTGLELPYTVFTYLVGYSFGPSQRDIQNEGPLAAVLAHPIQTTVGVLVSLALTVLVSRLRTTAAKRLMLLFLLPMLATWLGSAVTTKSYNVRYTLPGIIGFLGLVGLGLASVRQGQRAIGTALLVGLFLWADAQWFFAARYGKEDSRSAVAWLHSHLPTGSAVAVAPGYQAGVLTYYARREQADLVFVGLQTVSALDSASTSALLITRLHHVPHWPALIRSLPARSQDVTPGAGLLGYRAFLLRR